MVEALPRAFRGGSERLRNRRLPRRNAFMPDDEPRFLEIKSRFIRGRNALYARADFAPLYVDYYLHLQEHRLEPRPEADAMLKSALALFALHCATRPRNETLAWTLNFQDPLMNLFLGGDTSDGSVVGRAYTENVRKASENAFYQDLARLGRPTHRSVVAFEGGDMIKAVETFYRFSEQRPARFFEVEPEQYAVVAAHPDYDEAWFAALTTDSVRGLEAAEEMVEIETRLARWHCGCDQRRILQALAPSWRQDPEELFLNEELIEVNCPRCAAKYRVSRETMEAFVAEG